MTDTFTAYQTLCRRFLQDNEFNWEEDCDLVRRKVNAFVNGQIDARLDGSGTINSSSIGDSAFSFRVEGRFDPDALTGYATRFLALLEVYNPPDHAAGWESLTQAEEQALHLRALQVIRRKVLSRPKRGQADYTHLIL